MKLSTLATAVVIASLCAFSANAQGTLKVPTDIRCEYQSGENIVVDHQNPRLSWINSEDQSAYQILVSSTLSKLSKDEGDIWDSGKTVSNESHLVSYAGPELKSMQDCWWKVRIWNSKGEVSGWSETGRWNTGMLSQSDWSAKWIGAPWQEDAKDKWYAAAPMFRKEFSVRSGLVSARAYVCGLGWFEMSLNGSKVWSDFFVPGFTDYTLRPDLPVNPRIPLESEVTAYRSLYMGYDIKKALKSGGNAVSIALGNGYFHSAPSKQHKNETYGTPRLICQIVLDYEDGSREIIVSDETWKAAQSQIVYNDLYGGETDDATKAIKGWDKPGFNDAALQNARLAAVPDGPLTANMGPADRITEKIRPVSFEKLPDGTYKVDFGKEISGWIRFCGVKGHRGDTLKVKFVCESPEGDYKYVFSGRGKESFEPKFDWFVFREAIISGVRNLKPENLLAESVNSNVPVTSKFSCSNPLYEKILTAWERSQMDNMHSGVASDCPHRERLPYTGDGEIAMPMVLAHFDASAFYNKWIGDVRGSQNPASGLVPNGAPWEPMCGGGPAWGAAICIMPWEFYLAYGDESVLSSNLNAMKGYVRYLRSWVREDGTSLVQKNKPNGEKCRWYNLGEWVAPDGLPEDDLVHTFFLWLCERNTAMAAEALGDSAACAEYKALAQETANAFNAVFYDPAAHTYGDYGSNIFALYMGIPEERVEGVKETLRKELVIKNKSHVNVGFLAHRFFYETLSRYGLGDVACSVLSQKDYPSIGWWLEQGGTTTWEQWDGRNSRNHPMFGGGLTWFSSTLAGISADPKEPGFRHVIIRPIPSKTVGSVSYSQKTPYGMVSSAVTVDGSAVHVEVDVPFGSHATVYVPKSVEAAASAPLSDSSYTVHEVGAGHFVF